MSNIDRQRTTPLNLLRRLGYRNVHALDAAAHRESDKPNASRPHVESIFRLPAIVRADPPSHYLTVVAIVKDEATYLDEWIAFHRLVGVDHFYLYDNGSTDGTVALLEDYARRGFVTLIPWPSFLHRYTQRGAYAHALSSFGQASRWMMLIDADEFVFPGHCNSLPQALQPYCDLPGLLLPWHCFGHCGHEVRPDGLVIENYRRRAVIPNPHIADEFAGVLTRTKMIVDPARVLGTGVHDFPCDATPLTVRRQVLIHSEWRPSDADAIVINHYRTRSKEELATRLRKTRVASAEPRTPADLYKLQSVCDVMESASVEDLRIQRFVPQLQAAMTSVHGCPRA